LKSWSSAGIICSAPSSHTRESPRNGLVEPARRQAEQQSHLYL
jgi:hypothetical protein